MNKKLFIISLVLFLTLFTSLLAALIIIFNLREDSRAFNLEQNVCAVDSDCVRGVFCGCDTREYIDRKVEEYEREGIALSECSEPLRFASCACESGECVEVIDYEAMEKVRSELEENNTSLEGVSNLFDYREYEDFEPKNTDVAVIVEMPVVINEYLLKNENVERVNINLPSGLNLVTESSELVLCEDNESIANHLCLEDAYDWLGFVGRASYEQVHFTVSKEGLLGNLPAHQEENKYTIIGDEYENGRFYGRIVVR